MRNIDVRHGDRRATVVQHPGAYPKPIRPPRRITNKVSAVAGNIYGTLRDLPDVKSHPSRKVNINFKISSCDCPQVLPHSAGNATPCIFLFDSYQNKARDRETAARFLVV